MKKSHLIVIVAALCLIISGCSGGGDGRYDVELDPADYSEEIELLVFAKIQQETAQERAQIGLPEYKWDPERSYVARMHSADMAEHEYLSMRDLQGQLPKDRAAAAKMEYNKHSWQLTKRVEGETLQKLILIMSHWDEELSTAMEQYGYADIGAPDTVTTQVIGIPLGYTQDGEITHNEPEVVANAVVTMMKEPGEGMTEEDVFMVKRVELLMEYEYVGVGCVWHHNVDYVYPIYYCTIEYWWGDYTIPSG